MQGFEKLKLNYEFKRLYNRGKSFVSPYFILYHLKGRAGRTRLGITSGKKIGNAVSRNRAKRLITAAFSQCAGQIPQGYDFVIVARTRILECKSTAVKAELQRGLRAAGLWSEL